MLAATPEQYPIYPQTIDDLEFLFVLTAMTRKLCAKIDSTVNIYINSVVHTIS